MSHLDNAIIDTAIISTVAFEGRLEFKSLIDRISDVITSNPSFVRFRSKYNAETHTWTPINGWSAQQISICHSAVEDEESIKNAERRSIERVQSMHNGCAYYCHFKYDPVADETVWRFIGSHGIGDGYSVRSIVVSLLDNPVAQMPRTPKAPFGMSVYRVYNDIRLGKYLQSLEMMKLGAAESTTENIDAIDFPALSLHKIKAVAKENNVTTQDLLIHLIALTKKKIGEGEDDWIFCPFNQRGLKHLERMDNIQGPLPIYVGNGDLATIRRSTKLLKGSSLVTYKAYQRGNRQLAKQNGIAPPPQHRIVCLSNMIGVLGENRTVLNHKISRMRFHVEAPNIFFFISTGPSLYASFTIEESNLADRGELVRKSFLDIVKGLDLLPGSDDE